MLYLGFLFYIHDCGCPQAIKRAHQEAENYQRTVGRETEDISVVYKTTSCVKEEGVLGEEEDEGEEAGTASLKTADMETGE